MNNTYLVLGANGQLGSCFKHYFEREGLDCLALTKQECDITDYKSIIAKIEGFNPSVVINCSAYNAVDAAENDSNQAFLINSDAVKNLALNCLEKGVKFVHFSSDYVFDGHKNDFYNEVDSPHALNSYGESKLLGEEYVKEVLENYLIFRVSWVFGRGTQNFFHKLKQWSANNPTLKISSDEVSIPTYTEDIVKYTLMSLEKGLRGIYHLTNTNYASRYEVARYFAQKTGLSNIIIPVPSSSFNCLAKRPLFSPMSNQKLSIDLGVQLPTWQDALERFIKDN